MIFLFSFFCPAVKEAAVQRRHNLYRDSIILTNSDPNLHLLGETPPIDWATKLGVDEPEGSVDGGSIEGGGSGKRRRQVVSMIHLDGVPLPYESCQEVPGVELIPEEDAEMSEGKDEGQGDDDDELDLPEDPKSPDSVNEIRDLINPVVEMVMPTSKENQGDTTKGTEPTTGDIIVEDGVEEDATHLPTAVKVVPSQNLQDRSSPQTILRKLTGRKKQEADNKLQEETAVNNGTKETGRAALEDDCKQTAEVSAAESDSESPKPPQATDTGLGDDTGFQSPTNEGLDEGEPQPITNSLKGEDKIIDPAVLA